LDYHTERLQRAFPYKCRGNFGAARKTLNLFFREIIYNKYLSDRFNLPKEYKKNVEVIRWLEVPLDSHVALGIKRDYPELPLKWRSIKRLRAEESDLYQKCALEIADEMGTARIHLDILYWRPRSQK
jgi:hypothetical protein